MKLKFKFKSVSSLALSFMMCLSAVNTGHLQVLAEEMPDEETIVEVTEEETQDVSEVEPEINEETPVEAIAETEPQAEETETVETEQIILSSSSDFTFKTSGTNATITGFAAAPSQDFKVVFPSKVSDDAGNEYTVTSIESSGSVKFSSQKLLVAVTIPSTVTSLGKSALSSCGKLETVVFEEGIEITSILYRTFEACKSLTGIAIPEKDMLMVYPLHTPKLKFSIYFGKIAN